MEVEKEVLMLKENAEIESSRLNRSVKVDFYLPVNVREPGELSLLLLNDGQDMDKMDFGNILTELYEQRTVSPVVCAAIHAGIERKMEYGTARTPDFKGRGAKAKAYTDFIFLELLPHIHSTYNLPSFKEKVFAGFSLGGLSALDIVWNHPLQFSKAGVFSGSFWWRTKDQDNATYNDNTDRIMHQQIRTGTHHPGLKFFFECGALDEDKDRNQNGVIDSIDDTLDLIRELKAKGYSENDIEFVLLEDGTHDVATWGKAMPLFLKWAFGN